MCPEIEAVRSRLGLKGYVGTSVRVGSQASLACLRVDEVIIRVGDISVS